MPRKIQKAADLYDHPQRPYEDATTIIEIARDALQALEEPQVIADPEPEQGGDPDVIAYVNWGRWVGDCNLPDPTTGMACRNAQAIDPDDLRFFCIVCQNADVDGRWRTVVWPADPDAIEATLEDLPANEQNWTP